MSIFVRILVALLVTAGVALPIITTVISGITARSTYMFTFERIIKRLWVSVAMLTLTLTITMVLAVVTPWPYNNWGCLTVFALFGGMVGCGVNFPNALENLRKRELGADIAAADNVTSITAASKTS